MTDEFSFEVDTGNKVYAQELSDALNDLEGVQSGTILAKAFGTEAIAGIVVISLLSTVSISALAATIFKVLSAKNLKEIKIENKITLLNLATIESAITILKEKDGGDDS